MEVGISKHLSVATRTGMVFLCLSLAAFIFSGYTPAEDHRAICFLVTHAMVLVYFFGTWFTGKLKASPERRTITAIFVVILLIDAYTVNRVLTVFESTIPWFAITLIILCVNILAFSCFKQWPEWVRCLQSAILGFTLLAPVYLAIYLVNMYLIGLIGLVVIGISIITFSPLFLLWFNLRMVQKEIWPVFRYRVSYLSFLAVSVVIIIAYSLLYAVNVKTMDDAYYKIEDKGTGELPPWVKVAQQLPHGFMAERILKTNITYRAPIHSRGFDFWDMPKKEYDTDMQHDPLFMMSAALWGTTIIPDEDRLNILNVVFDKRHFSENRLWSGKALVTTKVSTVADLWPRYHLAYTEQTITVANHGRRGWAVSEEAIYTFHLPEGAVVTSLSLWINGKEEKGILTTKQKAEKAYNEIVGVQQRDPSVVHWQEGNRVVVRVFPVVENAERKFKIGITAPLTAKEGKLIYEPAWFEGPAYDDASYDIKLNMDTWPKEFSLPSGFKHDTGNTITRNGGYTGRWTLEMSDENIENAAFSFNGQRYTLLPYTPGYEFFAPQDYYLDVNESWQYSDYRDIVTQLKNKRVWIFHPKKGMLAVKEENKKQLFEELQQYRFSLFPFHRIEHPATALVITASTNISPQLGDIQDSQFRDDLHACFFQHAVRVYDIGTVLSPYLATLKESRSLLYEKGTTAKLLTQLNNNSFLKPEEDESQLIIAAAGMRIVRSTDSAGTTGPDHLARLFAYNRVMQQLGHRAGEKEVSDETDLITTAREAYIVSPLSSLAVLETAADYDKFDIKDDIDGLKNASLKEHGAVPEPHEWALFIVAVLLLAYVRFEKLLFRKKRNVC